MESSLGVCGCLGLHGVDPGVYRSADLRLRWAYD